MSERSTIRLGAVLLLCATGCFDGRDAHGLPCRSDAQCGNGQVCVDDLCKWPSELDEVDADSESDDNFPDLPAGTFDAHQRCSPGTPALLEPRFTTAPLEGETNSMAVAVGNFIGVGTETIAVVSRAAGDSPANVQLFQFQSVRYFIAASPVPIEPGPMDIASADLDGDGYTDAVVGFEGSAGIGLRVLWGASGGLLTPDESTLTLGDDTVYSVTVGDFVPGDNLEIVAAVGDERQDAVLVQVNDDRTLGSVTSISGVSTSPWDAITVDLDGVGPSEVLIAGSNDAAYDFEGSDEVRAYAASTGAISRFAAMEPLPTFLSPYGIDAGDVDGDGLTDLVVVGKNIERTEPVIAAESDLPSQFSVCFQRPGLTFECESRLTEEGVSGYNNVRLGDFDCDGDLDAFIGTSGTTAPGDGQSRVVWGPINGDAVSEIVETAGAVANRISVCDADGDGQPEIVAAMAGGSVRVYDVEAGT